VAKYKKKRARQLRHDKFRDATMGYVDRAAHRLEGKGRKILYGIGAVAVLGLIVWGVMAWMSNRNEKASQTLGRAMKVIQTPIASAAFPGQEGPTYRSEKERAQKAVEEFQKVAASYGGKTGEFARYFAATNQLLIDPGKATPELEALSKSGTPEIATLSKFALAQAREGEHKYEEAAAMYKELVALNSPILAPETVNLRLALVYEKIPDKKQEAIDLLFKMVETARKAKDKDGKPAPESASIQKAAEELEKLDPARFAQLPPPPLPEDFRVQ